MDGVVQEVIDRVLERVLELMRANGAGLRWTMPRLFANDTALVPAWLGRKYVYNLWVSLVAYTQEESCVGL